MKNSLKEIYLTLYKILLAFYIGMPIGILSLTFASVPDFTIYLKGLYFGIFVLLPVLHSRVGIAVIFLYVIYCYVIISGKKRGILLVFIFHYISVGLFMIFHIKFTPIHELQGFNRLTWERNYDLYLWMYASVFVFVSYHIFPAMYLFKRPTANRGTDLLASDSLTKNHRKWAKFGCVIWVIAIIIMLVIPLCYFLWQYSFLWFPVRIGKS